MAKGQDERSVDPTQGTVDLLERPSFIGGRYEIARTLGRGGLGQVFLARDVVTDSNVAVKTISGEPDDRRRAILIREARLQSKLAGLHRTFVPVRDVIVDQDQVFIVQEFVEGITLGQWQREEPRTRSEIFSVYREIASGLAVLHGAGIVHRDLKPHNVLVQADDTPRILDFGLAVPVEKLDVLTGAGFIVGTPLYMAPETIRGESFGPPVDVFALGVMLYEALTGIPPWSGAGSTSAMLLGRLKALTPEELADLVKRGTRSGAALVSAMLASNPVLRPTASEVAERLAAMCSESALASEGSIRESSPPPEPQALGGAMADAPVMASRLEEDGSPPATSQAEYVDLSRTTQVPAPERLSAHRRSPRLALIVLFAALIGVASLVVVGRVRNRVALEFDRTAITLILAGIVGVSSSAAWLRSLRRRRDADLAAALPLLSRVSAVEAQLKRTQHVTKSIALNLREIGSQLEADRIAKTVRASVIAAFQELRLEPTERNSDLGRTLKVIGELTATNRRPRISLLKKWGAYIALLSTTTTVAAGIFALMGNIDLWHANHSPVIVSLSASPHRIRQGAPVQIEVRATDADDDLLHYTATADAGQITGDGPTFLWRGIANDDHRIVTVSVEVSDGRKRARGQVSVAINSPPHLALEMPLRILAGAGTLLVARAEDDENDPLTYMWWFSAGEPQTAATSTVSWHAPHRAERMMVRCQVSDGVNNAEVTGEISVMSR